MTELVRLIVNSDSKDFEHGYHMGVDALEEISKATKSGDAEHEPLVMVGLLTVIIECAYRSCADPETVSEMIAVADSFARKAAELPDDTVH